MSEPLTGAAEAVASPWRVAIGLGVAFVVAQPFFYWHTFAGDAQIHLIFAENAARGAFFEFNPGEISSGVTSIGYMLWLASWFRLVPPEWVPVVAKLGGMLAFWAAAWMLFGLARDLLRSPGWAAAVALTFAAMPGTAYNSSVGMETPLFLALSVGWLWWATRCQWFSAVRVAPAADVGIGLLLGASFWIRPEAALIGACAFGLRAGNALRDGRVAQSAPGLLLSAASALCVAAPDLAFHHAFTGEWLPTSGRARVFIAQVVSPSFGPFIFDSGFPIRLAAYAPISLLFLASLRSLWRRDDGLGLGDAGRFCSLLFGVGFVLYTFVTGAHHVSRYVAFLMPGFALVAGASARSLYSDWEVRVPSFAVAHRSAAFFALAVAVAGTCVAEASYRAVLAAAQLPNWVGGVTGLEGARRAPRARTQTSAEWIERLGNPSERPIVIAMQEVQFRYELDDRFVVRSLDGRVDSSLLDFASKSGVDHVGYFRHRNVRFLFDAPHYVADPRQWSIAALRRLAPGEEVRREGLRFTRVGTEAVWRIDHERSGGPGPRSGRRGRRGGRSVLDPIPRELKDSPGP